MLKKLLYSLLFITITLQSATSVKTTLSEESIARLYVATFNRAPDSVGLEYWINSALTLEQIAQSFFDQEETRKLYPDAKDNREFIEAVYDNLFNRVADSEGAEYWLAELDSGKTHRSVFILAIINGALGDDAIILRNKTIVGLAFADAGMNDVDDAREIMNDVDATDTSVEEALKKFGLGQEQPTPPSPTPPQPTPPQATTQKGWYIRINTTANTLRDTHTVFGYLDGASDGKDRYDSEAMASSGLYSMIYHHDFGEKKEYRSDYRSNKKSGKQTEIWVLQVKYAKDKYADVTISWDGITYVQGIRGGGFNETHENSSLELENMRLVDTANGAVINVANTHSYSFSMDGSSMHEFKWMMLAEDEEEPEATNVNDMDSRPSTMRTMTTSAEDAEEPNKRMRFDPPFEE